MNTLQLLRFAAFGLVAALTTGTTAGLYWRPQPLLRLDVSTGRVMGGPGAGSATVGAGLAMRLGR